jgi:predicted GTPase
MLLVLTQIDRLRPFSEWEPPYDLSAPTGGKAASIRAAMEAAGAELDLPVDVIVPARVDVAVAPYNVDALWAKIIELAPDAQRARLLRSLSDIKSAAGWGTIWSQAVNAGRVIRGTFLSRSPEA